jgi:hypothetical protein
MNTNNNNKEYLNNSARRAIFNSNQSGVVEVLNINRKEKVIRKGNNK